MTFLQEELCHIQFMGILAPFRQYDAKAVNLIL